MTLRTGAAGACYGRENITVSRMPYKHHSNDRGKSQKDENGLN